MNTQVQLTEEILSGYALEIKTCHPKRRRFLFRLLINTATDSSDMKMSRKAHRILVEWKPNN